MRQILFQIPLDRPWNLGPFGQVPGFGFGIVLLAWCLYGAWAFYRRGKAAEWKLKAGDELSRAMTWMVVAALILLAPMWGQYCRVHGTEPFRDGLPIFGYGFMLFIGFFSGAKLASIRAKQEGLPGDLIWDLTTWLFIPGIVGARLFFLIQYGDRVFSGVPPHQWLWTAVNLSQGGIVLYGALLGGAAGYFSFCYFRRIRPLGLADIVVPSVFLGIGFGRIGCFLNGCCYGRFTTLPWGVQFPEKSAAFAGLMEKHLIDGASGCTPPLHPTQIYSSIDGFMIALITSWYFGHRRRNGEVLSVALFIYPITRFCIELLRGDEGGKFGTTLTISQWISIALFIVNIGFMIYLSRRPPVREPIALPLDSAKLERLPRGSAVSRS